MTEISQKFANLGNKKEGGLIAYVTVGDPNPDATVPLVGALVEGGADVIELGIAFSDPIADGPTIQSAVGRSLASGTKPQDVFKIARTIRQQYDVPLVLMTYFNPVFRFGLSKFLKLAKESNVSGMIVPDIPIEESAEYKRECLAAEIDTIFLAAPSTEPDRLKQILNQTSGYLYLISLYGVTGARSTIPESAFNLVRNYHKLVSDTIPLAVGFGISKPEQVRGLINAGADAVIVGSAFVNLIAQNAEDVDSAAKKLKTLAQDLKRATVDADH
ncbi:MAG TPA: tryptophan synthase subunit alpha [Terriglobales bacterium]|nr:tryptophan synthase subunit alpha [Terriglobales bacterium]